MDNITVSNLYSNTFSCTLQYKKDFDIDAFIDLITFHLYPTFGEDFTFYLTQFELIVKSNNYMWISETMASFSKLHKELNEYLYSPCRVSTSQVPHATSWIVHVLHGAIEKKTKISQTV